MGQDLPEIRCKCGQVIPEKSVTKRQHYRVTVEGAEAGEPPAREYLCLRFHCPRCRKVGEHLHRLEAGA